MLERIDHIAIAVEDIEKAMEVYENLFGIRPDHREYIPAFGVETATFRLDSTDIELIEGKKEDSSIRRFTEKNGPRIHHIAFLVDDIDETMKALEAKGARFVDEKPRRGKEGTRVAFLHPSSTGGILYELVERKPEASDE
jgi:methylmalonyl-CoA epimerase